MPMPADANQNGDIFGGWIMSQVDIAGGAVASRLARGRIATVAVKEFVFKQPVHIGDLLSFYVDLVRVGKTSVTVNVEVYAERRPSEPTVVKVTEATLTYVAIDASSLALVAALGIAGAVVGGIGGFGTGIILTAGLAPLIGVKNVIPVMTVASAIINCGRFWFYRSSLETGKLALVLACALPFVVVGVWIYSE